MNYNKVKECMDSVTWAMKPEVAVILGSGLGSLADEVQAEQIVEYSDIEGFPVSTVPGHKGRFILGYLEGKAVIIMQGRVHYYEGYDIQDVVLPTRMMGMLGAKKLMLTNAAGGLNSSFQAGDLMVIRDQIMNFVPSPLIGPNEQRFGTRFPAMESLYDKTLSQCILDAGMESGIEMKEGVYIQLTGPNYETPAEVRMCKALGADAVGMSTAVEAVAAKHMGMKVCGISCISNMGSGLSDKPLNHKEVQEIADKVSVDFKNIVRKTIKRI